MSSGNFAGGQDFLVEYREFRTCVAGAPQPVRRGGGRLCFTAS